MIILLINLDLGVKYVKRKKKDSLFNYFFHFGTQNGDLYKKKLTISQHNAQLLKKSLSYSSSKLKYVIAWFVFSSMSFSLSSSTAIELILID